MQIDLETLIVSMVGLSIEEAIEEIDRAIESCAPEDERGRRNLRAFKEGFVGGSQKASQDCDQVKAPF